MSTDVAVEHILVIPTEVFHKVGHFQGFSTDTAKYLPTLLDPQHASYRARPTMEEDPTFKQLIPYVIFRHVANGVERVFQYTRGKGQGEKRLHAKRSIGIGGHISTVDLERGESTVYDEGMRRELAEEVDFTGAHTIKCVGLINDDESAVGRVHLGIVHVVDLEEPTVKAREMDLVESGFVPAAQLLDDIEEFETWSQYALKALFKK